MYKVVISTDKDPIELREKVYSPEVRNPPISAIPDWNPPEDIVILRVGGVDYEVNQYDLNQAISPFLYADWQRVQE